MGFEDIIETELRNQKRLNESAERQLAEYERKLGMVAHMTALRSTCGQALGVVAELAEDCGENPLMQKKLAELRKLLGELERA